MYRPVACAFLFLAAFACGGFLGAPAEAANIIPEHPRLFFRSGHWGSRGLTLVALRQRAGRPEAAAILAQLQDSPPNLSLRAILLGDERAARQALEMLSTPFRWKELTTDEGIELAWRAMAYDWLYHHPAFSPEKKKQSAESLVAAAERLLRELDQGEPHIFHTRMYGWAMGIGLAGLALAGEHPRAEFLADYACRYFRQRLLPARRLQDGTVHNGFGYGRKYTLWLTAHFLSCWFSATGENLWERIQSDEGDWARREILFLWLGRYPDRSYLRFGDSYSLFSDHYTFRAVAERAWAYDDPAGWGILNRLIRENAGNVVEKSSAYVY